MRKITDPWEISQDVPPSNVPSLVPPMFYDSKPPNETWVRVLDVSNDRLVEAMAFYGRDGYAPHWQLRDGSCCPPHKFKSWTYLC